MKKTMLFALMLAALLAGCKGGDSAEREGSSTVAERQEAASKTITINIGTPPATIDPTKVSGIPESKIMAGLMETLISLDADCNPGPGAAESWEPSADFKTWTFRLRKDAKWHNGDPVTAHDFVYGLRRILTPSQEAKYAQIVYAFLEDGEAYYTAQGLDGKATLTSATATDDHTLVLKLAHLTPFFDTVVSHISWGPINRKVVEQHGDDWTAPGKFVGNGPFTLKEHKFRDRLTLERADTYWDKDSIFWDTVVLRCIEDENTENTAFVTGELDVTEGIPLPLIDQWRDKPEFFISDYLGTYYVGFNTKKPPLDDPRVRKAFSKAINREVIVNRVTKRGEPVATGIIPDGITSPLGGRYRDHAGDMIGPQDIEGAKKLLAEAGYGPNKPLPPVEYLYNTSEEHKIIGEQLQAMWRSALGVDVRLRNVEWGVRLDMTVSGEFQMARIGWIGDYIDPMTFLDIFTSENTQNDPRMTNERYDALVLAARDEADQAKRQEMLIAAERILIEEECAIAPIFFYAEPALVKTDIIGLQRNATGDLLYTRARRAEK